LKQLESLSFDKTTKFGREIMNFKSDMITRLAYNYRSAEE